MHSNIMLFCQVIFLRLKQYLLQMLFYAYEIANSMKLKRLECGMLNQKIKSKRKEIKKIVGGISIREAFIKTIQLEVYYIYNDINNNVILRDSIRVNLKSKYTVLTTQGYFIHTALLDFYCWECSTVSNLIICVSEFTSQIYKYKLVGNNEIK